jgi:SWI/SNF-related matrix-associated actin-dependent regulator 1 of chromatin subfamily A
VNWRVVADPVAIEHIPGLKAYGSTVVGSVDGMAVLAERLKLEAPPTPGELYVPRNASPPAIDGLRDYQLDGIARLVGNLQRDGGALLADDMGLGKTVQTIGIWNCLRRPQPLLVVAPASVRRGWIREFAKWAGLEATLVESGKQAASLTGKEPVVICSYDLVKKLSDAFVPYMVVMDEAHLLRGRMAGRSQSLLSICKLAGFRLALTGTPMWSRPRDFWMLLKILFGYRFGTADEFDYAYCGAKVNQWGGKENKGATRLAELKLRLPYVMLRRTKEQVASELPSFTRVIRWVTGTKQATKSLEAFALKQLSFADALNATLDAKLDAAIEAAMSAGKFLLVTWQKKHAEILHEKLNEEGYPCEIITGDYSHAEREAAIDRARSTGASVVCTIDSTNAGVDGLQHVASTAIFHALDYVPIKLAQMEARLHRIGQSQPVTAVYLAMEDSADSFVVNTVLDKLDAWKATMGSDATADMGDTMGAPNMKRSEEEALAAIYAAMGAE